MGFESKSKSIYFMKIYLSLFSFSVIVMEVSMERLYAAKFATISIESKVSATC